MNNINGLAGLRPAEKWAERLTSPPYDVIKEGSPLEKVLKNNDKSLYHVILGAEPKATLDRLFKDGVLVEDTTPGFYIYRQCYGNISRLGMLVAASVTPYDQKQVIRHEKTFDEKVKVRIKLMEDTGYITEPIWLLTRAPLGQLLAELMASQKPLYEFTSDFGGFSELSGIKNQIVKIEADSPEGKKLSDLINEGPLYIADGHHRYHSALKMGLKHCIAYVCQGEDAKIQAYNRVIKGPIAFEEIKDRLNLKEIKDFTTPPRHCFNIYSREGIWQYQALAVDETQVIGRLDCHILEKTLYPLLGLDHSMIMDERHFDYYPEQDLSKMMDLVDQGVYDIAVALHPVAAAELMAVADAGTQDPEVVMPEKSTFFAPKILSGLIMVPTIKSGITNN